MIRKDFPKLGEHYFEQRFANGLLVRVIEKPGFAKRYAFVATDYGSIDAEFILDGKKYTTPQGVAHYLEHKMFDLPEGNAMQEFAKYAGANNAFTSYTMTAYYVECTEHLEENLEILLRMVTTGYFTEESVQKERGITIVLVSHSMEDVAQYASRILVVNGGKIVFDDKPRKVFEHEKELNEMGLAIPQVTQLMHRLKSEGYPVFENAITVQEARKNLLMYFQGKKKQDCKSKDQNNQDQKSQIESRRKPEEKTV